VAAADLAKDLKRVRGGGGSDGALDEARGKMRDSAAAAAATEEMREAAARHRDMISLAFASLRSCSASLSAEGKRDGNGSVRARGVQLQRLKRRALSHRHVGPRVLPSAASSRGMDWMVFSPGPRTGEEPKTKPKPTDRRLIPSAVSKKAGEGRGNRGGDGAHALLAFLPLLLQP
jgi:hypothetical protein